MLNLVKIFSTEFDSVKRRVTKFVRLGKSDVQTSVEASPFGVDSNPPPNLRAIYATTGTKDGTFIIGYINVDQVAEVGEHRMFSTDEDGNLIFEARMRNDGTFEIGGSVDNLIRFAKMEIAFNQLKSDLNTLITAYNSHVHITTATVGATAVPGIIAPTASSGTPSAADMSDAKIEELKNELICDNP